MKRHWASWLAVLLLPVIAANQALGDPVARSYVSDTTFVFKAEDIAGRGIPYRLEVSDGHFIGGGQVLGDCARLALPRGTMVIYKPGSRDCTSISKLLASGGGKAWNAAGLRGLRQDRSEFMERLESSSVLRIEPRQQYVFRGQVCYCPIEPQPDSIFKNGFEGLAALL